LRFFAVASRPSIFSSSSSDSPISRLSVPRSAGVIALGVAYRLNAARLSASGTPSRSRMRPRSDGR
jgi:hypothetical protein